MMEGGQENCTMGNISVAPISQFQHFFINLLSLKCKGLPIGKKTLLKRTIFTDSRNFLIKRSPHTFHQLSFSKPKETSPTLPTTNILIFDKLKKTDISQLFKSEINRSFKNKKLTNICNTGYEQLERTFAKDDGFP